MSPFLSIIIPVYKVEPYLRECLDSIAVSQLDCWEAILIDDGSPDGCPQICDEYAARDSRFRVIHQENAGVAAARNAGLDVARGEWCWFVDSDDIVDMRPVGEMVEWLKEHQNVDLVMFDLETFKDGLPFTVDRLPTDVAADKNDFLMKHICYHHPRLWYHRRGWWYDSSINVRSSESHQICLNGRVVTDEGVANVEKMKSPIRFSQGIRVAEDLEFQYKYLTLCQHPVKVDVVLYYYRLRETSVTGDTVYRQRAVEDLPIVLKNMAAWTRENDVKPEPWYDYRIMKLLQNLLYSASCIKNLDIEEFQKGIDIIIKDYTKLHFPFVRDIRIWLAKKNVKAYFMFYKTYLKLKGIQS